MIDQQADHNDVTAPKLNKSYFLFVLARIWSPILAVAVTLSLTGS